MLDLCLFKLALRTSLKAVVTSKVEEADIPEDRRSKAEVLNAVIFYKY